jgi:hypothetical protein
MPRALDTTGLPKRAVPVALMSMMGVHSLNTKIPVPKL